MQLLRNTRAYAIGQLRPKPKPVSQVVRIVPESHDPDVDTFDAYDVLVERQAALDALRRPPLVMPSRSRLSVNDVNEAVAEAKKACDGPVLLSAAQCAVFWDIADEVWHAYVRQVARDDEEAKEKLEGEAWSLKRRTYDL